MPRGKKIPKRIITPDPVYNSELLTKFINFLMEDGKKSTAQRIVYKALEILADKKKANALKVFEEAIEAVKPQVEVRSRRVGGANYQVPMPVRGSRQYALACRWIIGAARGMKGKPMNERLAQVLMESVEGIGPAIEKRDDVHRMAEANKAFAHFARFRKK